MGLLKKLYKLLRISNIENAFSTTDRTKRELLNQYDEARKYYADLLLMSYRHESYREYKLRVNQYYFNHKDKYENKSNRLQFCFIPFVLKDKRFSILRDNEQDL